MKVIPLLPRFPGNKRSYRLWDGTRYDATIEPFAGSGIFSLEQCQRYPDTQAFFADADPTVQAVYHTWIWANKKACSKLIEWWQGKFATDDLDETWGKLKSVLTGYSSFSYEDVAAASLVLRKLTFGGVVRQNKQGDLNVKYVVCEIEKFLQWQYRFPPKAKATIADDWSECITAVKGWGIANPEKRAIALVDPPYWVKFDRSRDQAAATQRRQVGLMTPAYPGHEPHAPETLQMCLDCVAQLKAIPQVERIIVANYWSAELAEGLAAIAPFDCQFKGRMDGINRTRTATTQHQEAIWSWGETDFQQLAIA